LSSAELLATKMVEQTAVYLVPQLVAMMERHLAGCLVEWTVVPSAGRTEKHWVVRLAAKRAILMAVPMVDLTAMWMVDW
jgi:hypothetical protein